MAAYYPYGSYTQNQNNGLIWVQGEAGAKAYLVAPNTTVLLMDAEGDRFYLKTSDLSGMPSLRVFEYAEVTHRKAEQAENASDDHLHSYVTKDEFDALKRVVEGLAKGENNE